MDAYIIKKHQCNLIELFRRFNSKIKTNTLFLPPLTELEIYGQFATKIMNHPITQVPTILKCCNRDQFLTLWRETGEDLVFNGRDNFPETFWNNTKIEYQWDLDQALNC